MVTTSDRWLRGYHWALYECWATARNSGELNNGVVVEGLPRKRGLSSRGRGCVQTPPVNVNVSVIAVNRLNKTDMPAFVAIVRCRR